MHTNHNHEPTLSAELACHLPYAIFSVAISFALLAFWLFSPVSSADPIALHRGVHTLFHVFHFMHVVFSATGVVITYLRFGKGIGKALAVGAITAPIVCTLSDCILPFLGGRLFGVAVSFHFCWYSEWMNVAPFLLVGLLNGVVMSYHGASRQGSYSLFSHFAHILVSSFASLCYLVSQGFVTWYEHIGVLLLLMLVAVVLPCTVSDLVIPMFFAKANTKK